MSNGKQFKERVLEIFRKFDPNGDGTLELQQLVRLLRSLNDACDDDELRRLFGDFDSGKTSRIGFEEFVSWLWAEGPGCCGNQCPPWQRKTPRALLSQHPANRNTRHKRQPRHLIGHAQSYDVDGTLILMPRHHRRTLFFLHGAFETPRVYAELVSSGQLLLPEDCKLVVPQAPVLRLDLPKSTPGFEDGLGPLWFQYPQDCLTAEKSVISICELIAKEVSLVGLDSVHLAGFSQGGCIAWVIYAKGLARVDSFTSFCASPGLVHLLETERPVNCRAPALIYCGSEDLLFSREAVHNEVASLCAAGAASAISGIRYVTEEGLGHQCPRAKGFAAMVRLMNSSDTRRQLTKNRLCDGSIVLSPQNHRRTLVFLHGAFEDTQQYVDAVESGQFLPPADCKIVFPQAPMRVLRLPIGLLGSPCEREGHCWFEYPQDAATAEQSVDKICALLREEARAVGRQHVHLAGFSQGASIAWVIYAKQLAPIGSFTAFCAGPSLVMPVKPCAPLRTDARALLYLGAEDPIFPPEAVKDEVQELGRVCDVADLVLRIEECHGHECPSATGYDALVEFIDTPPAGPPSVAVQ